MRSSFVRAVLLGALVALALVALRAARAETTVLICTSATEPSPLRITRDSDRKTVLVEDVALSTRDLYPLNEATSAQFDAMLHGLGGKYQCRPGS